jgi:hypothetical protein
MEVPLALVVVLVALAAIRELIKVIMFLLTRKS